MIEVWIDGLCQPNPYIVGLTYIQPMLTDTEKAWAAGFVDGEGCITISKQIRKNRPTPAYRVFVTISNTKKNSLELFKEEYGGEIYDYKEQRKDRYGVKWANAYHWYCPITSSERFLTEILPYLRLKNEQANLALAFIQTRTNYTNRQVPEEELALRENFRQQIHQLNSKGVDARKMGVVEQL